MAVSSDRVKDIFLQAIELNSPDLRKAYLDEACGADDALRRYVEVMLQAHAAADSFLEKPAARLGATVDDPDGNPASGRSQTEGPGTRIGPYKLLEQIGEGGMGVVFMAEQQEPVRRVVALKIIKPGMDSAQVLARFEAERQALALMDHPNIARVLDAGATSGEPGRISAGRPYFVMELVKGTPITAFCDAKKLSPRQRLELFIPVCQGIQHAHQKGVIHRDIKPSNVLIALYDDKPVPKVIDFGVAKAAGQPLTERTLHTGFGAIVGTPEYMSPEQATFNQLDIDTRSDVYALGVLLYELLTGTTPVDKIRLKEAALLEVLRVVREEEPSRPSVKLSTASGRADIAATRGTDPERLVQLLRGELDWIVMKSLEKDRNRRYDTAAGLARDVDRYLKDELVEARPPSAGYRLRKFVRRNRGPFVAAGLMLLLLLAGTIGTTLGMFRAWKAEDQAHDARGVAEGNKQRADALKDEALRALTRNEGLRLLLQSELTRPSNPGLALLLGIEGAERHPGLLANNTLLASLDANREERTLLGHVGSVASLNFSPDGRRLLSPSLDGTVRLWDLDKGTHLILFDGELNQMFLAACFHPNGKQVLSTSSWGKAQLWDAHDGKPLAVLLDPEDQANRKSLDEFVSPSSFSPDGRHILTSFGQARLWDGITGKQILALKGHENRVNWAEFSHDGKRIVTASRDSTARIWDAGSGKELHVLKANKHILLTACFSPDDSRVLTVASPVGENRLLSNEPTCRLWDAKTGKELASLGSPTGVGDHPPLARFSPDGSRVFTTESYVWDGLTGKLLEQVKSNVLSTAAAFSPDGKHLAINLSGIRDEDKTIELWNLKPLQSVETLRGHGVPVKAIAYSPDGERLATADTNGDIRIWAVGGKTARQLGRWPQYKFLALSPDGRRMVTETPDRKALTIWDTETGLEMTRMMEKDFSINYARFSSDNRRIIFFGRRAAKGNAVWVVDAATGNLVAQLEDHPINLMSADLSPDGMRAVTTDWKNTHIHDLATGKKITGWTLGPDDGISSNGSQKIDVQFSLDGRRLLTPQVRGTILRDSATGATLAVLRPEKMGHTGRPALFSPDGRRVLTLSYSNWTPGQIWDADTGKELASLQRDDKRNISLWAAQFSEDGQWIASAADDWTARLWEANTGKQLMLLKGHENAVLWASFNPEKSRVVTASADKTVRLWNTSTGELLAVFQGHKDAVALAQFVPGNRVLSVETSGAVRVWPADPLPMARARAPRILTLEERRQYEVPAAVPR